MPDSELPSALHSCTYYPTMSYMAGCREYIRDTKRSVFTGLGTGLTDEMRWGLRIPHHAAHVIWYGSEAPLLLYEIPWRVTDEP